MMRGTIIGGCGVRVTSPASMGASWWWSRRATRRRRADGRVGGRHRPRSTRAAARRHGAFGSGRRARAARRADTVSLLCDAAVAALVEEPGNFLAACRRFGVVDGQVAEAVGPAVVVRPYCLPISAPGRGGGGRAAPTISCVRRPPDAVRADNVVVAFGHAGAPSRCRARCRWDKPKRPHRRRRGSPWSIGSSSTVKALTTAPISAS